MSADRVVGIRTQRHAPVILAWCTGNDPITNEQVALVDVDGRTALAQVAIAPERIILAPPEAVIGRVLAVGAESVEVAAALRQRDDAARQMARQVCGSAVVVSDARWSADGGRLTLVLEGEPPRSLEDLRDRLADAFKTEIRFAWTEATDSPHSE